ncbi:MAG: GNAT family N-acetyltransferase, partial [Clostridiales bacterium]|nr:GNAT family N-acetyltransferase [Candidatus Blautia equi]
MEFLEIHSEGKKYTAELIALYNEAFPPEEKKPWELMERLFEEKKMEILAITEGDTFIGLAANMLFGDHALLDYFAIASDKREMGYGSRAIRELQKRFAERTYILEIELCLPDAYNIGERRRRKAFYLRNGLK